MVRFSSSNSPSLTQMAARKQLRKHIRRIREREYSKLRALVPAVATKKKVTKVQVIEEAVRYIEELHTALIERFRQKHGCGAESMAQETVRTFVTQMMPPLRASPTPHPHPHPHHHPGSSLPNPSHPHPHPHPQQQQPPRGALQSQGGVLHHHHHQHHHHHPRPSLAGSVSLLPAGHPGYQQAARCPVPAFLSACSFEKQRKRASFLLRRRRRDC